MSSALVGEPACRHRMGSTGPRGACWKWNLLVTKCNQTVLLGSQLAQLIYDLRFVQPLRTKAA